MEKLCKIRDIQRLIAQYELDFEKTFGICLNEGMVLCTLSRQQMLSSGELSSQLGLTHSNTSKVIASVERKGYIERVLGKADKRQMYFTITVKGKDILGKIKESDIEIPKALDSIISGTR